MIKIIIADDHPIIRTGIKGLLRHKIGIDAEILEAENGDDIIRICKSEKITLLIMDLNMPDTDAQSTVKMALVLRPDLKILILSVSKEEIFGPIYLKLGAKGFLAKDAGEETLLRVVDTILKGNIHIRKELREYYNNSIHTNPYGQLTAREMEIMFQLIKGDSTAKIAQNLSIGITTVSTHKANLFRKLNINNVLELKSFVEHNPL